MVLIILHPQTKLSDSTNHESIESIQDYHEQKESSIKWSILDLKTEIHRKEDKIVSNVFLYCNGFRSSEVSGQIKID